VRKLRLTGGEPLLRKDSRTGRSCRAAHAGRRPLDLTLTTNGSLLARKAAA
jgi:cyclic pyranopterin phosphate synthase